MSRPEGLLGGRSIVLTGFMGTGKSTVGRLLAQRLRLDHVDTDSLIVRRHGPIPEIFAEHGEAGFRAIEHEAATELGGRTSLVISTGGRLMLDPANVAALSRSGRVISLTATPEEIIRRVTQSRTRRPLLEVDDPAARVRALLSEREHAYRRFVQVRSGSEPVATVVDGVQAVATLPPATISLARRPFVIGAAILPLLPDLTGVRSPLLVVSDAPAAADHVPSLGPVGRVLICDADTTPDAVRAVAREMVAAKGAAHVVAVGAAPTLRLAAAAMAEVDGARLVRVPTDLPAVLDCATSPGRAGTPTLVELAVLQTQPAAAARAGGAMLLRRLLSADAETWRKLTARAWTTRPVVLPGQLGSDQALLHAGLKLPESPAGQVADQPAEPASPTRLLLLATLAARMGRAPESLPQEVHGLARALRLDATEGWSEACARLAEHAGRPVSLPRVQGGPVRLPDRRTIRTSRVPG